MAAVIAVQRGTEQREAQYTLPDLTSSLETCLKQPLIDAAARRSTDILRASDSELQNRGNYHQCCASACTCLRLLANGYLKFI